MVYGRSLIYMNPNRTHHNLECAHSCMSASVIRCQRNLIRKIENVNKKRKTSGIAPTVECKKKDESIFLL